MNNMAERKVLLIGSLPFDNEEDAMARSLDILGEHLFSLPDGEIGEKTDEFPSGKRSCFVMTAILECVADSQNWTIVQEMDPHEDNGFMKDFKGRYILAPNHPPSEMHKHMNFGYHEYFKQNYPIFKRLRDERGLGHVKFQVCIPSAWNLVPLMMSPVKALRYMSSFTRRLAEEANEIINIGGDDVIIQVDIPAELAMAYYLPNFATGFAVNRVLQLIERLDSNASIGLHMCMGDLHNEIVSHHPKTLKKMANFSNRLVEAWPDTHKLEYIHFPLAEAADPPKLDPGFYSALSEITLPQETRFVAGFIHEKLTEDQLKELLRTIEDTRGEPVDIASSCGLGRRTTDVGQYLLDMASRIAVS